MTLSLRRVFVTLVALAVAIGSVATPVAVFAKAKPKPKAKARITVSAIPGADEKDFVNPVSRCLTKEIKAMHDQAVAQMQKDVEKYGKNHDKAAVTYKLYLEDAWSAMGEPYCGYGSYGLTAVKKSLKKTNDHARTAFLDAIKKK